MGNMLRPPSFWRKDDHVERAARLGHDHLRGGDSALRDDSKKDGQEHM
jgi:hypothetical protein